MSKASLEENIKELLEMSKKLRHRGPDWSGLYDCEKAILSHERLAIVDPTSGNQPLISPSKKLILAANGEIYNHKKIGNPPSTIWGTCSPLDEVFLK